LTAPSISPIPPETEIAELDSVPRRPPPRHAQLSGFRLLLIDSDPLLPTDKDVRLGIERLAGHLDKAGVSVARKSPLWPDFAASIRL